MIGVIAITLSDEQRPHDATYLVGATLAPTG